MYEITFIERGETEWMTYDEAVEIFGESEWGEILNGNLPHIVAVDVDIPDCGSVDPFRDDVEADADVLASAGYGTDEDYGFFGDDYY